MEGSEHLGTVQAQSLGSICQVLPSSLTQGHAVVPKKEHTFHNCEPSKCPVRWEFTHLPDPRNQNQKKPKAKKFSEIHVL